jgi:trimeric autotransporter adhesin
MSIRHHGVVSGAIWFVGGFILQTTLLCSAAWAGQVGTCRANDQRTVSAFVDSIGVNHHLTFAKSVYADPDRELRDLTYLGVRHVRDQVPGADDLPAFRKLAAHGVKFDLITSPVNTEVSRSFPEDLANAGSLATTGAVLSIEGPNELNGNQRVYWHGVSSNVPATAVNIMQALSRSVRHHVGLKHVAVVNLSIHNGVGNWRSYVRSLGDLSPLVDFANWHVYFAGGAQPRAIAKSMLNYALWSAPGRPVLFTEAGYSTAVADRMGVDGQTQAVHILNLLADTFDMGVARTYIYELMDGKLNPSSDDSENQFGLFRADGQPKPAAVGLHNLIATLSQEGTSQAAACADYDAGSLPRDGYSLQIATNDRVTNILLWNESQDWSSWWHARRTVTPTQMTLSFARAHARIEVFDPLQGLQPVASAQNARSIPVALADHLLVVRVQD